MILRAKLFAGILCWEHPSSIDQTWGCQEQTVILAGFLRM
jgi:hypothetical protein